LSRALQAASTIVIRPRFVVPGLTGDLVRRGFSIPSLASLEYWVARLSRAMTAVMVAKVRGHPRALRRFPPLVVPGLTGDPVRRGFSIPSLTALEYWGARSSRAMTAV
jgi:hypothetical protein